LNLFLIKFLNLVMRTVVFYGGGDGPSPYVAAPP
jgi:hypothetical protein